MLSGHNEDLSKVLQLMIFSFYLGLFWLFFFFLILPTTASDLGPGCNWTRVSAQRNTPALPDPRLSLHTLPLRPFALQSCCAFGSEGVKTERCRWPLALGGSSPPAKLFSSWEYPWGLIARNLNYNFSGGLRRAPVSKGGQKIRTSSCKMS